jgi:hypothetical protein
VLQATINHNTDEAFTKRGVAVNSGEGLDDLSMDECKKAMTNKLEDINKGGPSFVIACFRADAVGECPF